MRKYVLIFAMLAIVLTACRIESNVNIDIAEDGSATVLVEVGFDDEFRQLLTGQTGGSEEDFVNEILSFGDTSLVQRSEGDMTYYGAAQEIADLSQGLPAEAANEMFTSFDYTFDQDGASLTARIESIDAGDFGGGDLGGLAEGLTGDIFSANLIVQMPGTVTSHNADEVRDGALVWKIPLSGSLDVQAESSFGDSSTNWIWFALLIVVIVAGVAATIAVIVSRKQSEKAVAAAIAAYQAADDRRQTTDDRPEADGDGTEPDAVASEDDAETTEGAESTDDGQANDSPEDEPDNEIDGSAEDEIDESPEDDEVDKPSDDSDPASKD
jgi:type II secretory pathway pseudopilin PulG